MAPSFSYRDDEVLVEQVGNHPALWLLSNPCYKDQAVKDNIWIEIGNIVGQPIDLCKKRWKNIRDTFDRRQNRRIGSTITPIKGRKKWALDEKLFFLRTSEKHRRSKSREQITAHLKSKETERNRIMKTLHSTEENEDDVDLFFKSLAKSVKNLRPDLQQRAKSETLSVINQLEAEMWQPSNFGSSLSTISDTDAPHYKNPSYSSFHPSEP